MRYTGEREIQHESFEDRQRQIDLSSSLSFVSWNSFLPSIMGEGRYKANGVFFFDELELHFKQRSYIWLRMHCYEEKEKESDCKREEHLGHV